MNIIEIEICHSTNFSLKELAAKKALEKGTILVTGSQTAGRGQWGTSWEAEPGKNLTFSMILYPKFLAIQNHFLLSESIALGVATVLSTYVQGISIKWPNDIYYKDRKLAGILIENEIMDHAISQSIVGIGVNVNQDVFCSGALNPVSLKQIIGVETNLTLLLKQLSSSILYFYKQLERGVIDPVIRAYHETLYRREGFFLYKDKEGFFLARLASVGNNGLFCLIDDKEVNRCYTFKEVSFII
jgi:BirA family biotin operon repressor/biotin-[acetyl-CoA-carboxylase] ligase